MKRFIEWLDEEKYKYGGRQYSDSQLARDTGINKNTISAWMNEKKKPDRDNIHKLAVHFGVTSRKIYELLGETAPAGLDDVEELAMGEVKRAPKKESLLEWLRLFGQMTEAQREKEIARLKGAVESDDPHSKPVQATKTAKARTKA